MGNPAGSSGLFGVLWDTATNKVYVDTDQEAGSTWTVHGSVTANDAPGVGRVLLGNVQVRTSANVLIGSGDVVVQAVTP